MQEKLTTLPKLADRRGNLSIIENGADVPFRIARAYWIYDVPGGQKRGSHAFKNQQEIIFALSGSFDVVLDNGGKRRTYTLNRSNIGLYVPNKIWRSLNNFSTNSLCLVLASMPYTETEYIRNYKQFRKFVKYDPAQKLSLSPISAASPDRETVGNNTTVFDCNLLEFPVVRNNRAGNLTPVHGGENIPFNIERVFYVYDIPSGESRGGHAHKTCHQILIAASGSFDVELDDGKNRRTVTLNRPMVGLYLPPGIWAVEKNYSSGAICLVLASHAYEEADYIRKYADLKKFRADANS
ncbi:MAG: FdtA/QdtA family cupin domain-containing protein [Prevotella sp.]|jgi:oxalate decarboxylase/phosphoglucose isomerase-like protein (cupin superfamily)|nr:FdtA/QdtA family cupin domain-containing protein [Prevotella sp.]